LAVSLHPGSLRFAGGRRCVERYAPGRLMTNAQEAVIDGIVGQRKKRGFASTNLAQPIQSPFADVETIVIINVVSDREHRIRLGCSRSRLDQFDVAIRAGEIVSIDAANPAIVRILSVRQQWSNLQPLSGLTYRYIEIDKTTEETVWIPLRCVERVVVEVVAQCRRRTLRRHASHNANECDNHTYK